MARGSQEREQEFIQTAAETTGHSIETWMDIVNAADLAAKPNTIIKYLKTTHNLNHMQANYITGIYLNDGQPVYDYAVLLQRLFDGLEKWQPTYEALKEKVVAQFEDVVFVPTKTYISIEGERIFGCVKLAQSAIRLGLDLGETPFDSLVQKAKGLGAMPNITHMIELTGPEDITETVLDYTVQAYQCVHGA